MARFPSQMLRSKFVAVLACALAGYLLLWTLKLLGVIRPVTYAAGNTVFQAFFELGASWNFFRASRQLPAPRRTTFQWFGFACAALALSDSVYGVLFNTLALPGLAGSLGELWYTTPYAVFWLSSVAAFATILRTFPRLLQRLAWSFTALIVPILFIGVYADPLSRDALPLFCKIVYVLCIVGKSAMVVLASFVLAFSSHRGLRTVAAAWSALACYCFLAEYLEMNGTLTPVSLGEIIWTAGLFLLALGSDDRSWRHRKPWADVRSIRPVMFLSFVAVGGAGMLLPELLRRIAAALQWPVPAVGITFSGIAMLVVLAAWASQMGRQLLHEFVLGQWGDSVSPAWMAREFAVLRHTRSRAARARKLLLQFCHDVRAPLTALRAASQGLRGQGGKAGELVMVAAERFSALSEGYLARARTLPAVLSDEPSVPMQVEVACENFLAVHGKFRESFGLLLDPSLEDRVSKIDGWGVSLLVGNLLVNGAEAARDRAAGTRIRVRGQLLPSGAAHIEVEDDCGGFTPGVLARLRRGERLTTKADGSGLGLSGWSAQLKELGGSIVFENDGFSGHGARVSVTIPLR